MEFGKRITALLILTIFLACVVCGASGEIRRTPGNDPASSWINREDTIYLWYTDDNLTNYLNHVAVDFGDKENVHVLPYLIDRDGYMKKIAESSVKGSEYPDVFIVSHDNLEKAYLAGIASEVKDPDGVMNDSTFSEAALESVTYQGKYIAYPMSFETCVLLYNRTLLRDWAYQQAVRELTTSEEVDDEGEVKEVTIPIDQVDQYEINSLSDEYFLKSVPNTLDNLMEIADSFDAVEGVSSIMNWDVSDIMYNYWIVGDALKIGGPAGDDKNELSINNPRAIDNLRIYQKLHAFFSIEPNEVNYESSVDDFIHGRTLFTVVGYDALESIESYVNDEGNGFEYEYGVANIPDISETSPSRSLSVTQCIAVNGYSDQKDLANRFASYLITDAASNLEPMTGYLSSNRLTEKLDDNSRVFAAEYAKSVPMPKMMTVENYWMQVEVLFSKVWNGADPESELAELEKTVRQMLGL